MFEVEQFVGDCRAAFAEDATHKAIREVLARAMSDPAAVLKGLGEPKRPEIRKLFHSDSLTIINVVWAPMMTVMPHNHRMWAVIGIYTGREDNIFWRRVRGTPNKIEAVGAKALCEMDAEPLGPDIIHSVINPIERLTGAIYIYGGDFFCRRAQRVGFVDASGASFRRRAHPTHVRRSQRALRSKQTAPGKLTLPSPVKNLTFAVVRDDRSWH